MPDAQAGRVVSPPAASEPGPEAWGIGWPDELWEHIDRWDPDAPPPEVIVTSDEGDPILCAGSLSWLISPPGIGKTWLALAWAVQAALAGRRVLYASYDTSSQSVYQRIAMLGGEAAVKGRFLGVVHHGVLGMGQRPGNRELVESFAAWADLVVVDTASSSGCEVSGESIEGWKRAVLGPFLDAGCATLVLDHFAKSIENRHTPIGSITKLAAADLTLHLTGSMTDGLYLVPGKDRHALIPTEGLKITREAGVDDSGPWLRLKQVRSAPGGDAAQQVASALLEIVRKHGNRQEGISRKEARAMLTIGTSNDTLQRAVNLLQQRGAALVTQEGRGGKVILRPGPHAELWGDDAF